MTLIDEESSVQEIGNEDTYEPSTLVCVQPMTQQQTEVFLSAYKSADASRAYNLSQTFDFHGYLNVEVLIESIYRLGKRHDALRTTFYGPEMVACVSRDFNIDVRCFDISAESDEWKSAEIERMKDEEKHHLFDLTFGPLIRAHIIRRSESSHLLIVTLHHIIADGWSMRLFAKEIEEEYSAQIEAREASFSHVFQLSQYSRDQRSFRSTGQFRTVESYWLDVFKEHVPNLELPHPKSRPYQRTYNAQRTQLGIDPTLTKNILSFGSENNCTVFTLLYAAYVAYLYRLTGQEDLVIGVPYAGQADIGEFNLFGHCVNMLPIRNSVEGNGPFLELLDRVKQSILDAQRHGQITFSELLDRVSIDRNPARIPLVSATFNLIQDSGPLHFSGVDECRVEENSRSFETFEIALHVIQKSEDIEIYADFNTDLLDAETVDRWLSGYVELLTGVTRNPNELISELPSLSVQDNALLSRWNETAQSYPSTRCLHDLFVSQAKDSAEQVAVSFGSHQYSYQELDQRSNQLANFLVEKGVGPDVLVGLCVERSAEMLVALLGILKAGGGYLPLDPEYPRDRIEYILGNAEAPLLISQDSLLSSMPSHAGETVSLDGDWEQIKTFGSESVPATKVQPDNLAYVIYTSGSTGKPKGVQVTHRNVVNFLCSMQRQPGLTAKDKLLAVTTLSFDIAVLELYLPLISGAQVDIASRKMTLDAQALSHRIEELGISVMQATPATWRMLQDYGWQSNGALKALVGGEALPKDIVPGLLENTSELWNMYGPTETTVWSSCCQVTDADAPILIGKPIANTQLFVLDPQGKPVPVGVPGELYIGGDGVTRGYLKRPELNEKAFIDDPYHPRSGMKLYRTGDQVKLTATGDLQYITRLDNQVKVRGFRIELGEIETVLSSHDALRQSVVVVREDQPGDTRLVGYYVLLDSEEAPSVQSLREYLLQSLPGYMVPQHLMILESMPLTPNGKIDRKQLPTPEERNSVDSEPPSEEPRNDFERGILSVWKRLLNKSNLGIADDFFEHGGQSLLAVKAISEMEKTTGIEFDIGLIFEHSTVKQLVEALGSGAEQKSSNVVLLNDVSQEDIKKPPLFLLCGVDIYREMASTIQDRQVYGVYVFAELAIAQEAVEGKVGDISFTALCESYVEAISRIQPEGNVLLGGISFGGFIAFEVAAKLRALGRLEVENVMLLDTFLPSAFTRSYWKYFLYIINHPLKIPGKGLKRLVSFFSKPDAEVVQQSTDQQDAILLREQAFTDLMSRHEQVLSPSDANVTLYRATENEIQPWIKVKEDLGWSKLAPESLKIISVPGDHLSILRTRNACIIANSLS